MSDPALLAADDPDLHELREKIGAILGDDGALSRVIEGYEPRPQQVDMAVLVAKALRENRPAVLEAGTGTGKTLAYLVPALLSGRKVVVSTATKALQEQLVEKDLPLLRKLGADFRYALMKGRQNYLCHVRRERFEADPTFVSREEGALYPLIRAWAEKTATGERSELDLPENYAAWREVSSTADTCLGQECTRWADCFVVRMRQRAQDADVVVVNHHLFFADLALRGSPAAKAGAEIIPRYEAVIFDEAHNLEETATEFFGAQLSSFRFFDLCQDVDRTAKARESWPADELTRATSALGGAADRFFHALAETAPAEEGGRGRAGPREVSRSSARGAARAPEPKAADPRPAPPPANLNLFGPRAAPAEPARPALEAPVSDAELLARATVRAARPSSGDRRWALEPAMLAQAGPQRDTLAASLDALVAPLRALVSEREDAEAELFLRRADELQRLLAIFSEPPEPSMVHWVEQRGRGLFLRASPVDVSGELSRALFGGSAAAVMTSATLATGGDTAYFQRRIGLAPVPEGAPSAIEAVLPSPFDYQRQAALYLPRHLPEPSAPEFIAQAVEELAALIALAGGRTFALFTSTRAMQEAHRRLAPRLPYRTLLQGDKPKAAILREFREEPSVLFATQSFWEGVDVAGDALSMVVIDKLPFASPGDPLVAARLAHIDARGGSSFGEYSLPSAAIALKQGFGRLIRSRSDTGAVAILDRRLWTRGYGGYLRRSLPPCPTFDRFGELKQWWREVRGSGEP